MRESKVRRAYSNLVFIVENMTDAPILNPIFQIMDKDKFKKKEKTISVWLT